MSEARWSFELQAHKGLDLCHHPDSWSDFLQFQKSSFVWFPHAVMGIMEWIHRNLMRKKPIQIPNHQLFKRKLLFDPQTRDISIWNTSFLGVGRGGGCSLGSKVSNWQLAWWEQKKHRLWYSLGKLSHGAPWTTLLYPGDIFVETAGCLINNQNTCPLGSAGEKSQILSLQLPLLF